MPTDLYWTLDEDYVIGEDGDLKDTSFDALRSIWQEMRTRGMSDHYDWREHPTIGANLSSLIGRPNNQTIAEEGKANLLAAMTMGGFFPKSALNIRYLPIGRHRLLYTINTKIMDPMTGTTRLLKIQMTYDTIEGEATVL